MLIIKEIRTKFIKEGILTQKDILTVFKIMTFSNVYGTFYVFWGIPESESSKSTDILLV